MKRITMQQLAEQLGISGASVSLALSGKAGVSAQTRERVLAAARESGYLPQIRRPKRMAKHTSEPSDFRPVLLLVRREEWTDEAASFFTAMLEHLERLAGGLLIYYIDPPEKQNEADLEKLERINESASVVLLHGVNLSGKRMETVLAQLRPPVVVFDSAAQGLPVHSTAMDDAGIIAGAVRQFYRLGYRQFAFIRTPILREVPNHAARLAGFRTGTAECGVNSLELDLPAEQEFSAAQRRAFAARLRGRVCFSAQDSTAVEVYRLLGEKASEVILGGFDDFPCLKRIDTPVFTFRYETDSVCRTAMEMARQVSKQPYLLPVHIGVTTTMICRNFEPDNPPFVL